MGSVDDHMDAAYHHSDIAFRYSDETDHEAIANRALLQAQTEATLAVAAALQDLRWSLEQR